MDVVALILGGVGFVLLAVVGFTYHEGYDHTRLAIAESVVGFVSLVVSVGMRQSEIVDRNLDCTVGTVEYSDGRFESVRSACPSAWDVISPSAIELVQGMAVGLIALGLGWSAAQLTPRKPREKRPFLGHQDE